MPELQRRPVSPRLAVRTGEAGHEQKLDHRQALAQAGLVAGHHRQSLDAFGTTLEYRAGGGDYAVIRLAPGWTRIGRSGAADVRLDDPTVSRRHALVVLTDGGDLRALDDRSLNGLLVNGERVEWAALRDGDELEIGRYRLYVLEA